MQIQDTRDGHPSEQALEDYALARAGENETARIEEHLLMCGRCRDELVEIETYAGAMRAGLAAFTQPRRRRASWRPALAAGAAASALIAMVIPHGAPARDPEPVKLLAMRGMDAAHVHASRPVDVTIEAADLPDSTGYRLEVADARGRIVWTGAASSARGRITAREPRSLRAGLYWVRLYAADGTLLREYSLTADEP